MQWNEAKTLIEENVTEGKNLNTTRSKYREVISASHKCKTYDYQGEKGFLVRIGKRANLEIPWTMLKQCFDSLRDEGVYNGYVFRLHYPRQTRNHPCHVHVVGMMFKTSGLAMFSSKERTYHLRIETATHEMHPDKKWAYEILGLEPGALFQEIKLAHRTIINDRHPRNHYFDDDEKSAARRATRDAHKAYEALRPLHQPNRGRIRKRERQTPGEQATRFWENPVFSFLMTIVLAVGTLLIPVYLVLVVSSVWVLPEVMLNRIWPVPQQRPIVAVVLAMFIGSLVALMLQGDFTVIRGIHNRIRRLLARDKISKFNK